MAVLPDCGHLAPSLGACHLVESGPGIRLSIVCPCFDPNGGSNGSLATGMHPLHPTRLCLDTVEYRYLR